ncbi:MAG: FAD-dependent oxidoreductase [Gammaproteobacteria bacterium]|nr:FAD-dependent oxidoreductase [Gammaproteobacteria bacterium]
MATKRKHVLILGGNFAGLGAAQKIRDHAGTDIDITLIDRKAYLDYIPNIPLEMFEGRDPATTMHMNLIGPLARDGVAFRQAEVVGLDIDARKVLVRPNERPGAVEFAIPYDYLVIALGARLAYDEIEGFAEFGHSVSDAFLANRLIDYLRNDYRGGPIAVGSARFTQGSRGRPPWLKTALAACEGPPVEVSLALAHWLHANSKGSARNITIFTPAPMIAEDAGEKVVAQLLAAASGMGFGYLNNTQGIRRLTSKGIDFLDGRTLEAELKIVFPNWRPHSFLRGLPISDEVGFIVTDLHMRNPDHPEILACGDAAAVTVPKLGAIGHQQADIVGRQIAKDLGKISADKADAPFKPVVVCIGDMGGGKAFYIRADSWFGGETQVLRMGRIPYLQKIAYKEVFFRAGGRVPDWGLPVAEWVSESASK